MFVILFAGFVFAQTEEPDWQDIGTHRLEEEGTTFSKEAEDAVLKAISNDKKLGEYVSLKVTNFVEFCDDHDQRCFAAAIYTVDPTPEGSPNEDSMDQIQFLVWLERISDVRFEYRKLWEYQTGGAIVSGSLTVVDPATVPGVTTACVLVKTSQGGDGQNVDMLIICLGNSDGREIFWEYSGDFSTLSLQQGFRKSIVIFRDIDDDGVSGLILDSIEGYKAGFDQGDSTFQITMHRTVFYYSESAGKFLTSGQIPGGGPAIK